MNSQIKKFIANNFLFSDDTTAIDDEQSLMQTGVLDSTGVLELIQFVEETFGIKVPDEDMLPANFDSVRAIASYVQRKQQAA